MGKLEGPVENIHRIAGLHVAGAFVCFIHRQAEVAAVARATWHGRGGRNAETPGSIHISPGTVAYCNILFSKTLRAEPPGGDGLGITQHLQNIDAAGGRFDKSLTPAADESSGIYMTPNRIFSTDDSPVVRLQARPHLVLSIRTRERFTVHDFVANFDAQPSGPSTLRPTLELCFRPSASVVHECKRLFKPA